MYKGVTDVCLKDYYKRTNVKPLGSSSIIHSFQFEPGGWKPTGVAYTALLSITNSIVYNRTIVDEWDVFIKLSYGIEKLRHENGQIEGCTVMESYWRDMNYEVDEWRFHNSIKVK